MNRAIAEGLSPPKVKSIKPGHTHGSFLHSQRMRLKVNQVVVGPPISYAPGHLDGAEILDLIFTSAGVWHSMVEMGRIR